MRRVNNQHLKKLHGECIWLTGLSGSGKSTIACAIESELETSGIDIAMLDGDILRQNQTQKLGYTKTDRRLNVLLAARMASIATQSGQLAIVALVSPYMDAREEARQLIGPSRFTEVYVATPLEVCEQRDPKGLYAMARQNRIKDFTGIDAPYEIPSYPDITIDTSITTTQQAVNMIMAKYHE